MLAQNRVPRWVCYANPVAMATSEAEATSTGFHVFRLWNEASKVDVSFLLKRQLIQKGGKEMVYPIMMMIGVFVCRRTCECVKWWWCFT